MHNKHYIGFIATCFCIIFNVYSNIIKNFKLVENRMKCDCHRQSLSTEILKEAQRPKRQIIYEESRNPYHTQSTTLGTSEDYGQNANYWRRNCGCIRTSEKLKQILKSFPTPPPPSPITPPRNEQDRAQRQGCITAYCGQDNTPSHTPQSDKKLPDFPEKPALGEIEKPVLDSGNRWQVVAELVHLVQLMVTAAALAVYYVIYCYMQLIYFTLRSAVYFHQADGPMKVTIAVVSLTSFVIGFSLLQRMEKLFGINIEMK